MQLLGREARPQAINGRLGPVSVRAGLVPHGSQLLHAILEILVGGVGQAVLDRLVKPRELGGGGGRSLAKLGDVGVAAVDPFGPAVEHVAQQHLQALAMEKPPLQMIDNGVVQLVHGHGNARAGFLAHPGLGRAGVVAIGPVLAGPQGHGPAAEPAKADAAQERAGRHEARAHERGVAQAQRVLHGLELLGRDNGGHSADGVLLLGSLGFGLVVPGVEVVLALVGGAIENLVDRVDPEPSAIAGADVIVVEVIADGLEAHGAAAIDAEQGKLVDQPDLVGLDGVDLQLLLELGSAFLGHDDAIAQWRARAIPEPLTSVLLHGPKGVLGVLARLILVEEGHDLAHHGAHRIVAQLLGDGDQTHAILGELADIEFKLELIAEEPRERVDDDDVEGGGLGQGRLDHRLERGPTVVGGGVARLDEHLAQGPALAGAIGFKLAALVGDGEIAFGLTAGRYPQIQSRSRRHGGLFGDHRVAHRSTPALSWEITEQIVEHVGEEGFDDPGFVISHRDGVGPVVGDGDGGVALLSWRLTVQQGGWGAERRLGGVKLYLDGPRRLGGGVPAQGGSHGAWPGVPCGAERQASV